MTEREIFIAALQKEAPAQRQAYLDEACAGQPGLRQQVENLLQLHEGAGSFLEKPAADSAGTGAFQGAAEPPLSREAAGTIIGPYRLLQQIGEGGMGVVWMAEQTEPVKRKVALKVIKPGMDSRQVIARFEAERQALAMMDHVNIARVFDGGTTGRRASVPACSVPAGTSGDACATEGRPYFVMELVHGVPITKYCDDNHLTPRERLELFVPVCQAIQHAHQKGIIHRDIKPSNVMVTLYDGKPVPKVIDFGVAKATEQKLTERTLFTQYGTMVGTLEYMSPEQAELSALGVDTRSDIYSLGVLLYELLTGSTPLTHKRMKEAAHAEILRMIREEEPPKPSTRLSDSGEALASISAQRQTEPAKLTKLVRGELDWIVMKTLEKDRNRRYETAKDFAADVQRYLNDEPVEACPPSVGYRLRKFARRNKGVLAMSGLVLLFLVLFGSGIGWAVRDRAAREEQLSRERAERQGRLTDQLQLIVQDVKRLERDEKWPEALEVARRASDLMAGGEVTGEITGRVHDAIRALELVHRLEDIRSRKSEWKEKSFDYRGAARRYADAFRDFGIDLAQLTPEEAASRVESQSAVLAALIPALDDWAACRLISGDKAGTLTVWQVAGRVDHDPWRQKVRHALRARDVKGLLTLAAAAELGRQPAITLVELGSALASAGQVETALRVLFVAQQQHPADFWVHFGTAEALANNTPTNLEGSAGAYRSALALRPRSTAAWNNLGNVLDKQGKLDEAIACFRKTIQIDPKHIAAHGNYGITLGKQGKLDEAVSWLRKALAMDPQNIFAHTNLGVTLKRQGNLDEAIACHQRALDIDPNFAPAHFNLGSALDDQRKPSEAIACYRKAIELDANHAPAHRVLGAALLARRKLDEAVACFRKAIELDPNNATSHSNLGLVLSEQGKLDEAVGCYRRAIELDSKFVWAHGNLAWLLATCPDLKLRNPAEAVRLAEAAVRFASQDGNQWNTLGVARYRAGHYKAAVEALRQSAQLRKGGDAVDWFFLAMAHQRLDDKQEARKWYDRAVAWTEQNQPRNKVLHRFRTEAEEVLGIKKKH